MEKKLNRNQLGDLQSLLSRLTPHFFNTQSPDTTREAARTAAASLQAAQELHNLEAYCDLVYWLYSDSILQQDLSEDVDQDALAIAQGFLEEEGYKKAVEEDTDKALGLVFNSWLGHYVRHLRSQGANFPDSSFSHLFESYSMVGGTAPYTYGFCELKDLRACLDWLQQPGQIEAIEAFNASNPLAQNDGSTQDLKDGISTLSVWLK